MGSELRCWYLLQDPLYSGALAFWPANWIDLKFRSDIETICLLIWFLVGWFLLLTNSPVLIIIGLLDCLFQMLGWLRVSWLLSVVLEISSFHEEEKEGWEVSNRETGLGFVMRDSRFQDLRLTFVCFLVNLDASGEPMYSRFKLNGEV